LGDQPDEHREAPSGWRAGDQPGGPSGPGNEPLVYQRYLLDWEWKNYLGCLWIPALFLIIVISQWLAQIGVHQGLVQLVGVAAVFGVFLSFGLIDLSGYRRDWRRALIWLWLPGWVVLMIIATWLGASGIITIAATIAFLVTFWLYSRSGRHLDG
jgi:hypothetical protein